MSWKKGFNCRSTSGYVTDGLNQTYVLGTDVYPVTRNGATFGWDASINAADRNSALDVRIAGINFALGSNVLRVDLPAAGSYAVHLAVGDPSGGGTGTQTVTVRDNGSDLFSLTGRTYNTANQFYDAADVAFTQTTWPTTEKGVKKRFTSTVFQVACLDPGGFWVLAHLYLATARARQRQLC